MGEFNFNMDVNTSLRLLTGGKYCDRDIVITVQEAPETGVTVAKIGNTEYKSVEKALANAVSGDTVIMVADSDESGKTLVIPESVTLDIVEFTLKAGGVIGLDNSKLTATTIKSTNIDGRLFVPKGSFKLAEECASQISSTGTEYNVLPIYDTNLSCYRFARFEVLTNNDARKLVVDDEKIYFQFAINSTSKIKTEYVNNGLTDNELAVKIELTWDTESGTSKIEQAFSDSKVATTTQGYDLAYNLQGYKALGIDTQTLKVKAKIIANSGVAAIGQTWGIDGVIS